MKEKNCFYCTKDQNLTSLMIKICDFEYATLYLFKDQRYAGRCVLAFSNHKEELFELSSEEQIAFTNSLSKVAKSLKELFHADKINYAIYGDLVSHFHVHIVPKTKNGPEWGIPFTDTKEKIYLSEAEYANRINDIKNALNS